MGEFTRELALAHGARSARVLILPWAVPWDGRMPVTPLRSPPTVLFAGWLEAGKGVDVLLSALPAVVESVPDARLLLAGDGPERGRLEQQVESLGLRERATFMGWLNKADLRAAYERAWVVVLPSIWEEGLGMVLVEAGMMGRASVGSDRGGIREVIEHGATGLLVPPADPGNLADAIVHLLSDRERARQMGLHARTRARRYLDRREEALRKVESIMRQLMSDG